MSNPTGRRILRVRRRPAANDDDQYFENTFTLERMHKRNGYQLNGWWYGREGLQQWVRTRPTNPRTRRRLSDQEVSDILGAAPHAGNVPVAPAASPQAGRVAGVAAANLAAALGRAIAAQPAANAPEPYLFIERQLASGAKLYRVHFKPSRVSLGHVAMLQTLLNGTWTAPRQVDFIGLGREVLGQARSVIKVGIKEIARISASTRPLVMSRLGEYSVANAGAFVEALRAYVRRASPVAHERVQSRSGFAPEFSRAFRFSPRRR